MLLVGLTGGIATGKSTCSRMMAADGLHVLDCDSIAKNVTRKGCWGWRRVRRAFRAHDVFHDDGSIDRDKLGALIFADAELRRELNRATHLPILIAICTRLVASWFRCRRLVVVDMPLLFETRSDRFMSCTVVVTCSPEQQAKRLQGRDDVSAAVAQAKIDAQMDLSEKVGRADYVLDNTSMDSLYSQIWK